MSPFRPTVPHIFPREIANVRGERPQSSRGRDKVKRREIWHPQSSIYRNNSNFVALHVRMNQIRRHNHQSFYAKRIFQMKNVGIECVAR